MPLVLVYNAIVIYLLPCFGVYFVRIFGGIVGTFCCCICKAGPHSASLRLTVAHSASLCLTLLHVPHHLLSSTRTPQRHSSHCV